MFGIGFSELVVIAIVLIIAVGPNKLPQLMKTIGKAMREFRRASNELRKQTGIDELLAEDDRPKIKPRPYQPPKRRELTEEEKKQELPREGVDAAEATHAVSVATAPPADAGAAKLPPARPQSPVVGKPQSPVKAPVGASVPAAPAGPTGSARPAAPARPLPPRPPPPPSRLQSLKPSAPPSPSAPAPPAPPAPPPPTRKEGDG